MLNFRKPLEGVDRPRMEADVTIVGKTHEGDCLINPNVAIELGYALHACTDERVVLTFNNHYGKYEDINRAPRFIFASSAAPMRCLVSAVSGAAITT